MDSATKKMFEKARIHRRGTPKSKSGCTTCRIRHVKCDEQWPSCLRCSSAGRKCDGYSAHNSLRPKPDISSVISWKEDPTARRAFDFYYYNTLPNIAGYFTSALWNRLVLQVSHAEPAVYHAVVALGSMHEKLQSQRQSEILSTQPHPLPDTSYPLHQHIHALRGLQKLLVSANESEASLNTFFVCCLLCICFDVLRRDFGQALTHLRGVMQAMNSLEVAIDPLVVHAFVRLDVLASTMGLLGKPLSPSSVLTEPGTCRNFADLTEARHDLNCKIVQVYTFIRQTADGYRYQNPGNIPIWVVANLQTLIFDLNSWQNSFESMMPVTSEVVTDERSRKVLRMQYEMTLITLTNSLYAEESMHDLFDAEFEIIVSIAESLTEHTESVSGKLGIAPITFSFSLDLGVIQPLVMTTLKCRHPVIRHRAFSLLRSMASSTDIVTQEGGWDAVIFAKAAGRVVAIEEEGLDLSGTQRVREHRRVHQVTVVPKQDVRVLTLRMTSLPNGIDGGWEVNIERLSFDEPCDRYKPSIWNLD